MYHQSQVMQPGSMMLKPANRLKNIAPFRVMELLARANDLAEMGHDVIHMEVGEPDFPTPVPVVEAAHTALRQGRTKYTDARGIGPLRESVSVHYRARFGVDVSPDRIFITAGASGGLLLLSALLLNPGENLLMTDPGYPCNRHFLSSFNAEGLLAPMVMGLLFLAVFSLALGGDGRQVAGTPFLVFLAPGLIMMGLVHAAFEGAANSILHSKLDGTIIDVLMPPLGPSEFVVGHVLGGATRGLLVAAIMLLAMQPFVSLVPIHWGVVLFHGVAAALVLAMLGLIAGLWAPKWDSLAMINNFTITPLAFLSGVFYSNESLPAVWRAANHFNPFFYMIDGFRYGFIGHADASPFLGVAMIVGLCVALWLVCHRLVAVGYKLKT